MSSSMPFTCHVPCHLTSLWLMPHIIPHAAHSYHTYLTTYTAHHTSCRTSYLTPHDMTYLTPHPHSSHHYPPPGGDPSGWCGAWNGIHEPHCRAPRLWGSYLGLFRGSNMTHTRRVCYNAVHESSSTLHTTQRDTPPGGGGIQQSSRKH